MQQKLVTSKKCFSKYNLVSFHHHCYLLLHNYFQQKKKYEKPQEISIVLNTVRKK